MLDRGQVTSFFVVLAVILIGAWQVLSRGEVLRINNDLSQPAFVAQKSLRDRALAENFPSTTTSTRGCSTEECRIGMANVLVQDVAFLVIDDGAGSPKEFALEAASSTTALNLLQEACAGAGFPVKTSAYDFGVIIEAINNKRNGDGGKYWLCFVNGVMPTLPLDKIAVQPDDKVEFKFAPR